MTRIVDIQSEVARFYHIKTSDIASEHRSREFSYPRQMAMYLSRELGTQSLTVIGRWFHRHHTTVMHGVREVEKRALKSKTIRRELDELRQRIAG